MAVLHSESKSCSNSISPAIPISAGLGLGCAAWVRRSLAVRPRRVCTRSTFDHVDRKPSLRRFLVLGLHILAGLQHRLDDGIERDVMLAVAAQRHARRVDGL